MIGEYKAKVTCLPGQLKVSFFWSFKGGYWIIDLDDDYRWAGVLATVARVSSISV